MRASTKTPYTLLVCLWCLSGPVGAQFHTPGSASCSAALVPAIVRSEGIAEVQGDIVAVCILSSTVVTDVTVQLNVNVTNNRDFGHGPGAATATDAILIINEDTSAPMYGTLTADNTLQWYGVILPLPVSGNILTVRITNIRANASQLGVPSPAPVLPPFPVTAVVSFTGISVSPGPLDIGVPLPGLASSLLPGLSGESFRVRLSEGFATAFKTLGVPTTFPPSRWSRTDTPHPSPASTAAEPHRAPVSSSASSMSPKACAWSSPPPHTAARCT